MTKHRVRKLIVALIVSFQMSSCTAGDTEKICGILIILGNTDIERQVAVEFDKNSISYDWINGVLCADSKSSESVKTILSSVVARVLEPGNSASLHESIRNAVKRSLSEKKIVFYEIAFQGAIYLVWSAEDSEIVESVIAQEKQRFVRSLEQN